MNNQNLDSKKLDELLGIAGRKLGADPQKLKSQLEQGAFDDVIKNLNSKQSNQLGQLLNNPKALEMMLSTPQAQKLLRDLMGGK